MEANENGKVKLTMEYIGEDRLSAPVYRDQFGGLWKDVNLGDFEEPCLYSVSGNDPDGDPYKPIDREFTILKKKVFVSQEKKFLYQMLGRLKTDCEYYLGFGNRNAERLWAKSETGQIEEMKKIWNSFSDDEKPEWLTWEQIEVYEKEMVRPLTQG